MKLLLEQAQTVELLTESTDEGKRLYISGPFLMHSKKNRNNRIYSKGGMDKAVKQYIKEYVECNRSLGEMNHPKDRLAVDPERACIMTTELKPDGNYYYGKAKVLSTPLGKVLEALLNDGVKIGVSSRGVGSVSKKGDATYVGEDFHLSVAADVVHDPSVADAFVQHLMEEREYILVDGKYLEKDLFEARTKILRANRLDLETAKLACFENFIKKLSHK